MVAPGAEEFLSTNAPGSVAAARTHLRSAAAAAGDPGEHAGRARPHRRLRPRARVQGRVGDQRAARLPARGRSADHDVRPAPARRARSGRPLLRGQRRRHRCGRLDLPGQQHRPTPASRARSTTASPARGGRVAGDFTRSQRSTRPIAWRPADRGPARHHHLARDRHSGDGHPRGGGLQGQHRLRPGRPDAARARASTGASTCSSIRRCRSISPAPAGRFWSASAICSAIPPIPPRSTTSSSSCGRPKRVVGGFLVRF